MVNALQPSKGSFRKFVAGQPPSVYEAPTVPGAGLGMEETATSGYCSAQCFFHFAGRQHRLEAGLVEGPEPPAFARFPLDSDGTQV